MMPLNYRVTLSTLDADLSKSVTKLTVAFEKMLVQCLIPSYYVVMEVSADKFVIELIQVQIKDHDLEMELEKNFGGMSLAYEHELIDRTYELFEHIAQAQRNGFTLVDIKQKYPNKQGSFKYK